MNDDLIARLEQRASTYPLPTDTIFHEAAVALAKARDTALEDAAKVLHGMGDSAYCVGISMVKKDLCLGEEHKIKSGTFTLDNLKALEAAREKFGKANGLWDGASAIRAMKGK